MLVQHAFNRIVHQIAHRIPHRIAFGILGSAALLIGTTSGSLAEPHTLVASSQSFEMEGISGGPSLVSDCSATLPTQASQEIQLSDELIQQSGFLKFSLQADGNPVLLLEGPAGRFCSLGDSAAQQQPEVAGYWLPGLYRVYVGDRDGASHSYKLSIMQAEQ